MSFKTSAFEEEKRRFLYLFLNIISLAVSVVKITWWRLSSLLPFRLRTFFLLTFTLIFTSFFLLFFLTLDPDRSRTTCQMISSRGLPCEVHPVTTYQSYVVELHRIPAPGKPVAFLQTGLIGTSADFVMGEERMNFDLDLDSSSTSKSMAYELSKAGYDVWLSNNRGSVYGKGHQNLSSERDPKFWEFSFDQISVYDVPAFVDYVLNITKQGNK